ncbi:NAD-dependent epimerase/dehydratase family protein [Streptomyces sp. NPDC001606]
MLTILITGASGFVGRHVARAARRQRAALRLMSYRRPVSCPGPASGSHSGVRVVQADLADPASLRGVCDGVDVLIHCAAQIGGSVEANEAVNARGSTALVAEARRAGVSRIVQLSTASVYGRGTYVGSRPEQLTRNPGSPTSRTRAIAEDAVLSAGGIVLRPHLVYGEGDSWVGPGLTRLLRTLPGTVAGWPALMSVIAVSELAELMLATALAPASALTASVYHAGHPVPVTAHRVLRAVAECTGTPWPDRDLTPDEARAMLAGDARSTAVLDMLTTDHFFDCAPLWCALGRVPRDGFETAFQHAAPWYRASLQAA